jgi:hypothetical protein
MTPPQRRSLQLYLHFREQPMTVASLLWANRRIYLILLLLFGAMAAFAYSTFGSTGAAFLAVAFTVVLLRDIAHCRRSAAIWPVLQQVLDWKKIEQFASLTDSGNV